VPNHALIAAIDSAIREVDRALEKEMRTADGQPAAAHLDELRNQLLAIRARDALSADELRTMIRAVAKWSPEDEITLLGALGAIARVRSA
jgi:hypothetical protein